MKTRRTLLLATLPLLVAVSGTLVSCGDGTPTPAASSATAAATEAASATATVVETPSSNPTGAATIAPSSSPPQLQIGDPVDFPANLGLVIVESDCTQCDGYPLGLRRTYLDPAGVLRSDELAGGPDSSAPLRGSFVNFSFGADGWRMAAAVCIRGGCGSLNYPTPDSQTAIDLSDDGGASWQQLVVLDGGAAVVAVLSSGVVVQRGSPPRSPFMYTLYPGGAALLPPLGARLDATPSAIGVDELGWLDTSLTRILASDGSVAYQAPPGEQAGTLTAASDSSGAAASIVVTYPHSDSPSATTRHLRVINASGVSGEVSYDGFVGAPAAAIGTSGLLLNLFAMPGDLKWRIGFADFGQRTLHPIANTGAVSRFDWAAAVEYGLFARVNTPGDCLKVRASGGGASDVVTCAADGTLLRQRLEAQRFGTETWIHVDLPDGRDGWVAAEFVER